MTPNALGVNRGRHDLLYDPKGHDDLCCRFEPVNDPSRSRGHYRSPWPSLWPKRSRWHLWPVCLSSWPKKGHGVIRGRHDLFYDPKGHGDHLWSVWPSFLPKRVMESLEAAVAYFMTPKVTVTVVVGDLVYDPKRVKHMTLHVTTNVQPTL